MSLPKPEPGLVIRYSFLWSDEKAQGREEGAKDRPCAIILAIHHSDDLKVTVAPITHTPPSNVEHAIEIPSAVKKHLGLDEQTSWVVLNEFNRFTWPGPDLRPISNSNLSRIDYGFLPPRLFRAIQDRIRDILSQHRVKSVNRTE